MRFHPATLMLLVWLLCVAMFLILPFELTTRSVTIGGFLNLALFIGTFCLGSLLYTAHYRMRGTTGRSSATDLVVVDFGRLDLILTVVATASIVLSAIQVAQGGLLNLQAGWEIRSERAYDLLTGQESQSGLLFQMAFLLYPVSYILLIREIVFERKIRAVRLAFFGLTPIVLVSLLQGGRGPILYALLTASVAGLARRRLDLKAGRRRVRKVTARAIFLGMGLMVISLVALNYFVEVFLVRAEGAGGIETMFRVAESDWGVTFSGPTAELMFSTLGRGNSYLIFVFAWYLVQGMIIANDLFSNYFGPPHFGIYGLELVTAVTRRIAGDLVADRFYTLLDLNIYGFLPSAFGALYVDFKYGGLIPSFFWGYIAAIVYHRTAEARDARWFLVAPIVTLGIVFSLINTPLGFVNGTMIHLWLVVAFFAARARPVRLRQNAPGASPYGRSPAGQGHLAENR